MEDQISLVYETRKWGKPARMELTSLADVDPADTVWVEVLLKDENDVPCLDATDVVRFSLAGDGELIDNLGTSTGARTVQVCNGVARIRVKMNKATNVVAVKSAGLATQFITLNPAQ